MADSATTAAGDQTTEGGSALYLLDGSYLDDAGYLHVPDGSLTLRVKNYKGSLQRIFLNLDFLYNQPVLAEVFARDEGNSYPYSLGDGRILLQSVPENRYLKVYPYGKVSDFYIRIQTAAAYEHLGKREEARAWLGKALSGAAPDGLVMPFVENYAHLKPLLAQDLKTDLIAKITELGEGAGARNAASARPAVFDALTPREFEIVELMTQRLSNREIAEKLYLSEGSVKQYVNQIYSKLHMEGDTRTKRKRLAELFGQKT